MNKMMLTAYNTYSSSGSYDYSDCSTSDDGIRFGLYSSFVQPYTEKIEQISDAKYSVYEIANWFLLKETMSHKKLQKLCYYAQAWFYALKDFKLMDTTFEAWVHGPVSPALYEKFKTFGYSSIKLAGNYIPRIDDDDLELLESIWSTYGDHTGNALEALSHSEQPWIQARVGYNPSEKCNIPISVSTMKAYYRSIYSGGDA